MVPKGLHGVAHSSPQRNESESKAWAESNIAGSFRIYRPRLARILGCWARKLAGANPVKCLMFQVLTKEFLSPKPQYHSSKTHIL